MVEVLWKYVKVYHFLCLRHLILKKLLLYSQP